MFDACKTSNYVRKDTLERLILEEVNGFLRKFNLNKETFLTSLKEKFQLQADEEIRKKKRTLAKNKATNFRHRPHYPKDLRRQSERQTFRRTLQNDERQLRKGAK